MTITSTISQARREELNDVLRIGRLSWAAFRRHKGLIFGATILALGVTVAYLLLAKEAYTAASRILIDNRVLTLTQQDAIQSVSSVSPQLMQSQVEILRSDTIARRVIDQLNLLNYPEFGAQDSSVAADPPPAAAPAPAIAEGSAPEETEMTRELRRALNIFQKRLAVEQVGQSYVIEIRMTATDPQRAAEITNSIVAAYLDDQAKANAEVAQSASGWLRDRLRSLGTSARVLSAATSPLQKDGPAAAIILAFAGFCGFLLGCGGAFGRELLDRKLRTRDGVRSAARAECFGITPTIQRPSLFRWRKEEVAAPVASADGVVAKSPPLDWAMERPQTMFAHSLRKARAALFAGNASTPVAMGVTSTLPREGKTVIAANFARVAAASGKAVLLIDAVTYNSQLTKMLAPRADKGLADALRGVPLDQILLRDRWTQMHFLPGMLDQAAQPDGVLVPKALERLLAQLKSHYDLIVLDLPPILPVSDVHEFAPILDKLLLVVEWGRSTDEDVAAVLAHSGAIRSKLFGALLNKADTRRLGHYADEADLMASSAYAEYVNDKPQRGGAPLPGSIKQYEYDKPPPQNRRNDAASIHLRRVQAAKARDSSYEDGAGENA